jgi:hypothetical protein
MCVLMGSLGAAFAAEYEQVLLPRMQVVSKQRLTAHLLSGEDVVPRISGSLPHLARPCQTMLIP